MLGSDCSDIWYIAFEQYNVYAHFTQLPRYVIH